jgi:hypothetical protein
MSDSNKPHLDDRIDRYVRSELTPAEARELAQKSLDDAGLFEELTFSALANAALADSSVAERLKMPEAGAKVVRFPRKARVYLSAVAAAAAVVVVSLYSLRSSLLRENRPAASQNKLGETAPLRRLTPALGFSAKPGQPVLLASGLQPEARRELAPIFRGLELDSHPPRPAGSILSIEDGLATINLGSLDGLAKGTELRVFRDERFTQPLGRLIVTTVFRERARGRIAAGQEIPVNSWVRPPATVYLGALWQQVDALSNRGHADAARAIAEKAVEWTQTANVRPGDRRIAYERLAALEYQAGSLPAAEKYYQWAVDTLNAEPLASAQEQSVAFNNLALLHLLRGDYDGAATPLNQAVSKSPKTDSMYGRCLNNLGVLAELRGERRKAEALYADALRVFAGIPDFPPQERSAVDTNLARLRNSR